MRTIARRLLTAAAFTFASLPCVALADGIIASENANTARVTSDFLATNDGTAANDGVVDVYPDQWSVTAGTTVHLRIRSSGSGYTVQVFRLGYYGGKGAREVTPDSGISGAADEQGYPTPDAKYGLAASGWHDSASIDTTGFVPGLYVARVTQTDDKARNADTFFVVRDDTLAAHQPLLFVISFNTHEAYNAWPGPNRGGKSLYAFNSSPAAVSSTNAAVRKNQAVKVSFQRPFFVGGGTADVLRWEYPMIRFLEGSGGEVAYALDRDLDAMPQLTNGRKAMIVSGHSEYWTGQMFTNALNARDAGVNMLFVTGDTLSWQVRFEDGGDTMVGYKENWPNDPMNKTNPDAVTRGFATLPHPRPGIQLTGVMSSGQIKNSDGSGKDFPYADWIVANSDHWLFQGTSLTDKSVIPSVMGYEVDSCSLNSPQLDPYRPGTQVILGLMTQPWDGLKKGSPCYYEKKLGDGRNVEVLAIGSMAFTWALDDYAEKQGYPGSPSTVSIDAQKMITNVLTRWTNGSPPTWTPDGGLEDVGTDPGSLDPEDGGGGSTNSDPAANGGGSGGAHGGFCSVQTVGGETPATLSFELFGLAMIAGLRRRRRDR